MHFVGLEGSDGVTEGEGIVEYVNVLRELVGEICLC